MTRGEMRRRLAAGFETRGWAYDLTTVAGMLDRVEASGNVDPQALAAGVAGGFLKKNVATRQELTEVIAAAIGGAGLTPEETAPPGGLSVTAGNNVFVIQAPGAVFNAPVNQGGTQVNLDAGSADDVLRAVAALFASGLQGHWQPNAARAISEVIEERDDISVDQIREAAIEAAREVGSEPGRIETFLEDVAVSGIKATLATGFSAALGQLPGLLG